MSIEEGKTVFTNICSLYVRGQDWQKSIHSSRVTVYHLPKATGDSYRLVITSCDNGDIQINAPIGPSLVPKRLRDDFLAFVVLYGDGQVVAYGVQLKAKKYAGQLLVALTTAHMSRKKKSFDIQLSEPSGFTKVSNPDFSALTAPVSGPISPALEQARKEAQAALQRRPSAAVPVAAPGTIPPPLVGGFGHAEPPPPRRALPPAGGGTRGGPPPPAAAQPPSDNDLALAAQLLQSLPQQLVRFDASQISLGTAIGKGSYGTVYEGRFNGRPVAVKQLDVTANAGAVEKSLEEFGAEARLMFRIPEHPNTLGIIGVLVAMPQLSIVMEFMELTDLYAVLTSGNAISAQMEDMWIRGLAAGVRHVARNGIIHRDIAARNVLLNREYHPKLADFGLAIAVGETLGPEETAVNKWLAPEAIEHRRFSLKSDVWSFGVTVYEILTKKIPYAGLDPMMAAMSIIGDRINPGIPDGCQPVYAQLLRECFVHNPNQRADMERSCAILQVTW